jgi:hypothetical protein
MWKFHIFEITDTVMFSGLTFALSQKVVTARARNNNVQQKLIITISTCIFPVNKLYVPSVDERDRC